MNLTNYLNRINYNGPIAPLADVLIGLHRAHTLSVPFENLDILDKNEITINTQKFYNKIVNHKRGGFCYEMNGLFNEVLQHIGFKTFFISCNVFIPPINAFGADFGHVALIVDLGDLYLADVGFGDAFIEPLKIVYDVPQEQYGMYYKLSKLNEEEILLEKSNDGEVYTNMFKFSLLERKLEDFSEMCSFHQTSPKAPFTKGKLISKPIIDGRITLTDKALIETKKGEKHETLIEGAKDFEEKLQKYFAIAL